MYKLLKGSSATALLTLLVSLLTMLPAFAAADVRVPILESDGAYMTITNVVKSEPAARLYIAEGPVTITFNGKNLAWESIDYAPTVERFGDDIQFPDATEVVTFDVKRYTNTGETAVLDELVQQPGDYPIYVTGNYATLRKPGYYLVMTAPEAAAPTMLAVQVVAAGSEPVPTPAPVPEEIWAVPTSAKVLVNGEAVAFGAYQINGNNYFKLRDLAMALSGTEKQFEVTWDGEKNAINLLTGRSYTSVGGELAVAENPQPQVATPTASKIYLNGEEVPFAAYTIGGNNYFKLRDIGKAMDFGITWDASANRIGIDSKSSYTE
ncbi:MAG TPA: hypothetical protein VD973_10740 [Symbiobacteriaceae bacterium]|nr:hypothetical protein [Symbiobacteriaceae bacterium]